MKFFQLFSYTFFFVFSAFSQSSPQQTTWEDKLRSVPSEGNLRAYMERLSARPHHLGSPYDKEVAEWIYARFKEWGFDARIESFDVLFPTPLERVVELVEPYSFKATLLEPALSEDPTSSMLAEQLPSYNAYSIDGDVTAPLVYVNYGIREDYEQLERLGISVKGAIVIARYGASWRGIKPKLAAEHGAVGCIIYSDPRGDGYFQGDVYPDGPYRNETGVQRGSVMDMPLYPGDPLTPGKPATEDSDRLDLDDVKTLTMIPVLPISYGDAQPLLKALKGPVAPASWRGALPITYHVGPGPAKVHLKVKSSWDIKRIYDAIGVIKGSTYPDEWIIRGNHHDAWVFGAQDPISGMAAVLEEARAFGELMKQGWKPKRTIVYCGWDAEEQGLIGSTEWAEAHADELKQKAIVYINSDSNGRGYLYVAGSHTLEPFINDVARDIVDPEKGISVWKRSQLARIAGARTDEDRRTYRSAKNLPIDALGSGSDYTTFLQHLGIAALNIGYGGEDGGGIYHSIYDSYAWYTRFSDTTFVYGKALAQTGGTTVLRLADATLLPFHFASFSSTVADYLKEVRQLRESMQKEIEERNREIEEGMFSATADPHDRFVPPPAEAVPPYLNFAPLENAVAALEKSADVYEKIRTRLEKEGTTAIPKKDLQHINTLLLRSERMMTDDAGLPVRPWFTHMIYAPGFYTGYDVKTLPGVREAIEEKDWKLAEKEIVRVAGVLDRVAHHIDAIVEAMNHHVTQASEEQEP